MAVEVWVWSQGEGELVRNGYGVKWQFVKDRREVKVEKWRERMGNGS